MERMEEKIAAQGLSQRLNPAMLVQMNERLGSIEARLTAIDTRMGGLATKGELRAWAGLISGLIAVAVGAILKCG